MRAMRAALLLLTLGSIATAGAAQKTWVGQTTRDANAPQATTTSHAIGSSAPASANAVELVELTGMRKRFEADRNNGMIEAQQALLRTYSGVNPAFLNEWSRRVTAGMKTDDYVALEASVYASHFTDDELALLVQGRKNVTAGKPSEVPPDLRDKARKLLPTVAGEIAGEFAQRTATLAAQTALQVAKEHPGWIKQPPAPAVATK